jgi:hypothetical protein
MSRERVRARSEGSLQWKAEAAAAGSLAADSDSSGPTRLSPAVAALLAANPLPGRRLSSVRVKQAAERPAILRKLSGKPQDAAPTLVFTFTDDEGETAEPESGLEGLSVESLLDRLDTDSVRQHGLAHGLGPPIDRTDTVSVRSFMTDHAAAEEENVPDEVIRERAQRFWDFFTMVTSITYAILIITIGIVMYAGDLFMVASFDSHYSEIYNIFLSSVGILWLLWFLFDIQRYIHSLRGHCGQGASIAGLQLVEGQDGEFHIEIPMLTEKKKIPEYYGFSKGRESGSFFLKIGAAVFCFGHLSNICLNLYRKVHIFNNSTKVEREVCVGGAIMGPVVLVNDFIYFLFSIIQLFTIFKSGNVIVNKNKSIARFGFMHCISSSLCFWMHTIMKETLDAYVEKSNPHDSCSDDGSSNTTASPHLLSSSGGPDVISDDPLQCIRSNHLGHTVSMARGLQCVVDIHHYCITVDDISKTIVSVADWFYPFSIEFSILVVGVWYVLWSNIGNIGGNKDTLELLPSSSPMGSHEELARTEGHKQAMVLYADCSSSTKGMFVGLSLLMFSFTSCLTMYVLVDDCTVKNYVMFAQIGECIIFATLTVASASLYYKIAQRDVNPDPISFLDDLLLVVCLPAFFMFGILSLAANILGDNTGPAGPAPLVLAATTRVLSILQVAFQTPMIVDGLRRCSNSAWAQEHRAGRNTLTFLIVANLAVYIFQTFLLKANIYQTEVDFFTLEMWMVLSHMTQPLCIFYRFHSAVALADIWSSAYKPAHYHSD